MKTKPLFLLNCLLILLCSVASAQKKPIKWGKILASDTSMTVYKADPKAPAVVLCDFGTTEIGPRTEYTRHVRIKILKEEGIKYANVEIPYRYYDHYDDITGLKAQTINVLPNGKLKFTRVKGKNIEDIQVDNRNKKKVIQFQDVKVGSIIEYSYSIFSLDLVRLREWYFQSTIPVMWSEYRLYVPRWFNYLVTFQKGRALDYDEQKAFADQLQWLYSTKETKTLRELAGKKYVLYESPKGTVKVYYAKGESYRFIMNDVPALEPQRGMLSLTDFYPVVKSHLYLADGNFPWRYRRILVAAREDYDWENARREYYNSMVGFIAYWLPTWDEAVKKWLDSDRLGHQLIKAVDYKPVFEKAFNADATAYEKAKGIYQYVKDNVQWNGTYSMYTDRDLKDVLKKKSGNSGEINLLLINLLKRADIDAKPVLVRTLDLGRPENIYPMFNQFNQVIAMIKVNGQTLFLDASGKNSSFSSLPWNINNAEGFLLTKQDYKWVDVANKQTNTQQASITSL